MINSFYTTNNHNYKKSKESKTDLKVIAADIIDDTDWLYWLALVSHQEQLDTCPSFPDLYCSLTNIHYRTLPWLKIGILSVVQLFLDDALSEQIFPVDDTVRIRTEIITRKQWNIGQSLK